MPPLLNLANKNASNLHRLRKLNRIVEKSTYLTQEIKKHFEMHGTVIKCLHIKMLASISLNRKSASEGANG
jgi:hypothetical protein